MVFPGQGAQRVGMGKAFYDESPAARARFEEASAQLGFDVAEMCFTGPEERLKETANTQVALFVTETAAWAAYTESCGVKPDAAAGHSVGEYAALVASGAMQFKDGLRIVKRRGELMAAAAAARPGTMAALLGIDAESARTACETVRAQGGGQVFVANYNGGGQIVISGEMGAVQLAGEEARKLGAKRVVPLNVSGAFHSPLMVVAGDALYSEVQKTAFVKPSIPVVLNVSAAYLERPDDIIGGLTMQVSRSVLWEQTIQRLLAEGVTTFLELGCGDTLTGLLRRIDKSARGVAINDLETLREACAMLKQPAEQGTAD
jgi:[acyl-carrier-protein] S-malonyltransferase